MTARSGAEQVTAMQVIDRMVESYRQSLLMAFGLSGRMECDGPDATDVPPAVSAGLGGIPVGVSASSPELPPAGTSDPSHMCPPLGCRGVCGEGPAADSGIRKPPAVGRQLPTGAVESGLDMGGRYAAELFPQHSKYQQ